MSSYLDRVIPAFIAGRSKNYTTLRSEHNEGTRVTTLFSYSTEIAYRSEDDGEVVFAVSTEKYSSTTSRQQNYLRRQLESAGFRPTADVVTQDVYTRGIFYQASPTTRTDFIIWRHNGRFLTN